MWVRRYLGLSRLWSPFLPECQSRKKDAWFGLKTAGFLTVLFELAAVYATRIPEPVSSLFPDFLWAGDPGGREVHLTFDDGPHPEWTPRILDLLGASGHKATFFCVGQNVERYPKVFERIQSEGHSWGNHTMHHESGWSTGQYAYLKSFLECEAITKSGLFRPPYGRMTRSQAKAISKRSCIVMWNLLTGDFDQKRTVSQCLNSTRAHLSPGTIAVMHDSQKASPRTLGLLEGVLRTLQDQGWMGAPLDMPIRP